ncbi:MAG: hypothetical protein WD512_17360 [Candidatus Paceibacterota bacterium]
MTNKALEVYKTKIEIAKNKHFKSRCAVCKCKLSKHGMTFHHMWYIFNDVIYKNYPRTVEGKLNYIQELKPLILECPERFRFLCNTDHQALERLYRYGDQKLNSLLKLRRTMKLHEKDRS